jgi:hypothetical protein
MSRRRKQITAGVLSARRRQELRRSNAAVPIPSARHKKPRSMQRQEIKEQYR